MNKGWKDDRYLKKKRKKKGKRVERKLIHSAELLELVDPRFFHVPATFSRAATTRLVATSSERARPYLFTRFPAALRLITASEILLRFARAFE